MNQATIPLLAALGILSAGTARAGDLPSVKTSADTFHVATLNAWGLPFPVARGRARRLPAIARFVERSGFDVVGLQEVWNGARRHLSLPGLLFPNRVHGDSGLALVSSHPASAPRVTPFQHATGPDALKHKGVLSSQVELTRHRKLWTLVTHLQAGRGAKPARIRQQQVGVVLDVIEHLPGPAVVVGDFNFYDTPEDRDSELRLKSAGLVDAAAREGETSPTYVGSDHRFDRVFLRSEDGVELKPVAANVIHYGGPLPQLSDHRPLHVELAWVDHSLQQARNSTP